MKIFVTGPKGNLGQALLNLGAEPFESDVLNFDAVKEEMNTKSPHVLIHLVSPPVEIEDYQKALHLAVWGTANVIDKQLFPHVRTIYISSSHVFDGKKGKYRENDKPNPVNDYGLCKIAAEQIARTDGAKIIRLSTCFNEQHKDIVEWTDGITYATEMHLPYIVEAPTFIRRTYAHVNHIAEGMMSFASRWDDMPPLMNISGTEDLSMYEFLLAVANHYGWDKKVMKPRKKEIIRENLAKRPYRAGLNTNLARRYKIPLYSAYEGIALL